MDLTKDYPRSPREKLDGIMLLPRAIDKARAQLEGKLGEYIYFGCGLNAQLFKALDVTENEFLDAVRHSRTDEDVVRWIREHVRPDHRKIEQMNARLLAEPKSEEERREIRDEADEVDPGNDKVKTHIDVIDLEEGRLQKESATAT